MQTEMKQFIISVPPEQAIQILNKSQNKIITATFPKAQMPFIVYVACHFKYSILARKYDATNQKYVYKLYNPRKDDISQLKEEDIVNNKVFAKFILGRNSVYELKGGFANYLYIYNPHKVFKSEEEKNKLFGEDYVGKLDENPRNIMSRSGYTQKEFIRFAKKNHIFYIWHIDVLRKYDRLIPINEFGLKKTPTGWNCATSSLSDEILSWDLKIPVPKKELTINESVESSQN